ncbi:hypothetical protein C8R42DRAFT_637171 [Lentinula raphanica]|nr:hypothetical protein C8R42DRAFT_637171 [Lentinula raphanica]
MYTSCGSSEVAEAVENDIKSLNANSKLYRDGASMNERPTFFFGAQSRTHKVFSIDLTTLATYRGRSSPSSGFPYSTKCVFRFWQRENFEHELHNTLHACCVLHAGPVGPAENNAEDMTRTASCHVTATAKSRVLVCAEEQSYSMTVPIPAWSNARGARVFLLLRIRTWPHSKEQAPVQDMMYLRVATFLDAQMYSYHSIGVDSWGKYMKGARTEHTNNMVSGVTSILQEEERIFPLKTTLRPNSQKNELDVDEGVDIEVKMVIGSPWHLWALLRRQFHQRISTTTVTQTRMSLSKTVLLHKISRLRCPPGAVSVGLD